MVQGEDWKARPSSLHREGKGVNPLGGALLQSPGDTIVLQLPSEAGLLADSAPWFIRLDV